MATPNGNGLKVDLACGEDKKAGYVGIDIEDYGQQIIGDITRKLPFRDGTVERFDAWHIFEHLYWEDAYNVLMECHRCLEKDGKLHIQTPDGLDPTQFRPYHIIHYSKQSFDFMKDKKNEFYPLYRVANVYIRNDYGHINFILQKK